MAVSFAVPSFAMGARLLQVWRDPMAVENGRWVGLGTGVFILEFVLLHAGVLLGTIGASTDGMGGKLATMAGLTLFYGLFAGALSLAFKSRMLLESFLWMIGGRFAALAIGVSQDETNLITSHAVVGSVLYFGLVLASVFLPIPRWGLTREVALATRTPGATGTWADEPHRAIGAAPSYFCLLGAIELLVMTWIEPGALMPR